MPKAQWQPRPAHTGSEARVEEDSDQGGQGKGNRAGRRWKDEEGLQKGKRKVQEASKRKDAKDEFLQRQSCDNALESQLPERTGQRKQELLEPGKGKASACT